MKNTQISKMYKYSPFRDLGTHSNTLKKLLKEQDGLLKMIDPYLPLDGGISHFSKALFLSLFSKKPEKEMATHSGVLAWRILGTVEPGGLPSMGSHRVIHN